MTAKDFIEEELLTRNFHFFLLSYSAMVAIKDFYIKFWLKSICTSKKVLDKPKT